MVRLFVRHHVRDFSNWLKEYKNFAKTQKEHGVQAEGVYKDVADPHEVTIWHDFKDNATAQAFVKMPALKAAMEKSGVTGTPTTWIAEMAH